MNINVESRFSHLPNVDIQRSKFFRPHQHKTTFNAGELIPIFVDEVLPGDTFTLDTSTLIRMTTPIFPTMDNAYLDMYYFFVPNRLVWDHWKEFNGENSTDYWTQKVDYQVPQLLLTEYGADKGSIADYFGIPTGVRDRVTDDLNKGLSVSALPFRAYTLIWNEWFRDQNTMPPAFFTKSDDNRFIQLREFVENTIEPNVTELDLTLSKAIDGAKPLPVSKYHDYFTSVLPEPQKGPAVDLPLYQDKIPVDTGAVHSIAGLNPLEFSNIGGNYIGSDVALKKRSSINTWQLYTNGSSGSYSEPTGTGLIPNNLYADVSQVAVASISQLRQAFQLQRLYEKDARGGTRYREILKMHFGVDSPDARQQVPEYLGGKRIPINIDQVLQTSATNDVSPQGNTAAYSLTSDIDSSFTKSFTEHGLIIGVACVRTEHTYQQGIERFWSRKDRFDYYWPSLANISEQAVLVKEIYCAGSSHDNDAFGYQEAWADYRYKPNRVSGAFRSNYSQSLDSWHYADYYTGGNDKFVLSPEWLIETPVNIDRTLAVPSETEDQFIADFYFKLECVRPMPLYSVPGLIDHY